MRKLSIGLIALAVFFGSCRQKPKVNAIPESRTTGSTELLVDESFARILDDQIQVFQNEYPDAKVKTILGNENKILPDFLNGKVGMIVLSRKLTKSEELYFKGKVGMYADRFAIDGIALITNVANLDTNITVNDVYDILRGTGKGNRKLVFDNANSSTVRYFTDSAKVKELPKTGVYTLQTNNDVIKYVAEHKDYIGVVGVNWLLENNKDILAYLPQIKMMNVKNLSGKKGSDGYYKPTQENLISGVYPFLRNVIVINCEGKDGLGTGFATWLCSPRGQLIVLKSGLGPHQMLSRDFNIKKD